MWLLPRVRDRPQCATRGGVTGESRLQSCRARLSRRGPRLAGRERTGGGVAVDGHCRRVRRAPAVGAPARRRTLVGGLVARGVRRPRRVARRVGHLRGGVLPRRSSGTGLAERHLPARADHLRPRHRRAAATLAAVDGDRREDLGAGLVRARGRVRPRLTAVDRHGGRRWLAAERAEDLVVPCGVRPPGVRAVPLRPRGRAASRADVFLLPARRGRRDRTPDRAARR